ncbi:tetratricopeptide repeat protein [bacterium]|nr:tetratricopeptide repeat protein [bacterium]
MKRYYLFFLVMLSLPVYSQSVKPQIRMTLIAPNEILNDSNSWMLAGLPLSFKKIIQDVADVTVEHTEALPKNNTAVSVFTYEIVVAAGIDKKKVNFIVNVQSGAKTLLKENKYSSEWPLDATYEKIISDFVKAAALNIKAGTIKSGVHFSSSYTSTRSYLQGRILEWLSMPDSALKVYQKAIKEDPQFADGYEAVAFTSVLLKKYDDAIGYYQQLLSKDSTRKNIYREIGDIYFFNKDDAKRARSAYRNELDRNPNDTRSWIQLGYCYLVAKDFELSKNQATKALSLDPGSAGALNLAGLASMGLKDTVTAQKYFIDAIRANEKEIPARKNLARLYEIRKQWNEARDVYEAIAAIDPWDAFVQISLANLYYNQNNFKKAVLSFTNALLIKPEFENNKTNPVQTFQFISKNKKDIRPVQALSDSLNDELLGGDLNTQQEFQYRVTLGYMALYYLSDSREAVNQFQIGIKMQPDKNSLKFYLGEAFYAAGKFQEALDYYKQYGELADDSYTYARCHLMMGKILVQQKLYPEAQLEILKSIRIYPNAESYFYYGMALRGNQQWAEAENALAKALATYPHYTEATMELGRTYALQKKYSEALQQYRKTVELDSMRAEVRALMAEVYIAQSQYPEAESEIKKGLAIALPPAGAPLYELYGDIYLIQKQFDLARQQFLNEITSDSNATMGYYKTASTFAAQKDAKQSVSWLERAFQKKFNSFGLLDNDKLFDPIRKDKGFNDLVTRYRNQVKQEILKLLNPQKN